MTYTRKLAFVLGFAFSIICLLAIKPIEISFFAAVAVSIGVGAVISIFPYPSSLDEISATQAGNNQHGSSRFSTEKETKSSFIFVKDGEEKIPGIVIGRQDGVWIVDTSDNSATMLAPPGALKTTGLIIPTMLYNALVNFNTKGKGASILSTDLKGEELLKVGNFLKARGVTVAYLDFSNPLGSFCFNLMFNINRYMDIYLHSESEQEKVIAYARAERYSKILAESIVDNMEGTSRSEAGQYFTETAKGLITGIVLLVSQYGEEGQRHIISVFKLIIELNGLTADSTPERQTSKLAKLLQHIDNDRIVNYVGPVMSADVRQSMNVFSSALGKLVAFIDAELEQMICSHSKELNDIDFIEKPTAIFLICPDENPTRNFFASLFIRYLMNDLIEQARATENILKRQVFCLWDEFGNMPAIKGVDILISAARSRGIRFLLALQSMSQLRKNYTENMADIVFDSVQILIFTRVSPTAFKTAKMLSDMLGTQTITSGSVSKGNGKSTTLQMISRPLMFPSEIIMGLKQGEYIVAKSGNFPIKTNLPHYTTYFDEKIEPFIITTENPVVIIDYLTIEMLNNMVNKPLELTTGMFD